METLRSRKWGIVKYPKGTKPVVVEVTSIVGATKGVKAHRETVVLKEGLGIKRKEDVPALIKALEEKVKKELPIDAKAEFSIHFPKTRKKPVKFTTVGGLPSEPRILYFTGGYDIQEELKEDIKKEWKRHPKRKTATDLEVMAYIMSASGAGPLDGYHTRIYLHLFRKYLKSKGWKKFEGSMSFLNEHKSLSDYEKRLLQGLKDWIWKRQQKDLAERKRHAKKILKERGGK
jgi:hypothetical protein